VRRKSRLERFDGSGVMALRIVRWSWSSWGVWVGMFPYIKA
jgi:hypothetical protein